MNVLLVTAIGLGTGITLRSLFFFSWAPIVFVLILGGIFIAARLQKGRAAYLLCAIFCISAALGAARFHIFDSPPPETFLADVGHKVSYEGVVVDEPDVRDTQGRITIEVSKDDARTKILAIADRYPMPTYGDTVKITGTLVLPEPFDTDAGRVFRYDSFLKKDGIHFLIEFGRVEILHKHNFSLYGALYEIKNAFNGALSNVLPEPHASLAGGLVLGGKQGLGEDLKEAFTLSGLIHIVVLSGYNVMIVAIAVMRLFAFLPRKWGATLAASVIALFVLMAGAGSASIRAGLMAGLGLFARATTRTFDALRALLAVAILMVLWNPAILVFDPGFQLSCMATLGLIIGSPLIAYRLAFIKTEFLREIASSTIAAQVFVLPLLLYQTGLYSLAALPANLIVLPLVPLAMGLSFIAGVASLVAPFLSTLAGLPAYVVLSLITAAAEAAAALPLSAISIPAFPFIFVLCMYAALAYQVWRLQKQMPMPKGERVVLHTSTS